MTLPLSDKVSITHHVVLPKAPLLRPPSTCTDGVLRFCCALEVNRTPLELAVLPSPPRVPLVATKGEVAAAEARRLVFLAEGGAVL